MRRVGGCRTLLVCKGLGLETTSLPTDCIFRSTRCTGMRQLVFDQEEPDGDHLSKRNCPRPGDPQWGTRFPWHARTFPDPAGLFGGWRNARRISETIPGRKPRASHRRVGRSQESPLGPLREMKILIDECLPDELNESVVAMATD